MQNAISETASPQAPEFELLKRCSRPGRPTAKGRREDPSPCSCKPLSQGGDSCAAESQCLNRSVTFSILVHVLSYQWLQSDRWCDSLIC